MIKSNCVPDKKLTRLERYSLKIIDLNHTIIDDQIESNCVSDSNHTFKIKKEMI